MLKIIQFLLLILVGKLYEARYECNQGVYPCHVSQWYPWGSCSVTCGGGFKTREKVLCCPQNTAFSQCLTACNLASSDVIEKRPCAQTCEHGVYDQTINQCVCPNEYKGACCQLSSALNDYEVAKTSATDEVVESTSENCFQNKSVTTLVAFMVVMVIALAAAVTVLTYLTLKLKKELYGLQMSNSFTKGSAPVSTTMKK